MLSEHVYKGFSDTEPATELTHQFIGLGNYDQEVHSKVHDTPNWVAKFRFNATKKLIEHPDDMKEQSILIMLGDVPNMDEYAEDKIIIVSAQSILLLDNWTCIRELKDEDSMN